MYYIIIVAWHLKTLYIINLFDSWFIVTHNEAFFSSVTVVDYTKITNIYYAMECNYYSLLVKK